MSKAPLLVCNSTIVQLGIERSGTTVMWQILNYLFGNGRDILPPHNASRWGSENVFKTHGPYAEFKDQSYTLICCARHPFDVFVRPLG